MRRLFPTLCVAILLSIAVSCASVGRQSQDYIFSVTGLVTDEDGRPVPQAEIVLRVGRPVYEGTVAFEEKASETGATGGFVFMYNSHHSRVDYSLTVRKDGFTSQSVSGTAPPAGHHTIRLRRAAR